MVKRPSFLETSSCLKDQATWINLPHQGYSCAELPDSTSPFPLAVLYLIPVRKILANNNHYLILYSPVSLFSVQLAGSRFRFLELFPCVKLNILNHCGFS
ncbi:hypothetical protein XENOCAPTIV_012906 [Xenoophorus captivus]|uniref:Uncharacterized protein n=1 Tax=Xenoophorus captivus TaxID=1517983 RepID=A0ABV0SCN0_9TELE